MTDYVAKPWEFDDDIVLVRTRSGEGGVPVSRDWAESIDWIDTSELGEVEYR